MGKGRKAKKPKPPESGVFRVDTYPFGGVKGSGLGREGVRWAMESMTEPRMLVLSLRGRP